MNDYDYVKVKYLNGNGFSEKAYAYRVRKFTDIGIRDIVIAPTINGDQTAIVVEKQNNSSNGCQARCEITKRLAKFNGNKNSSFGTYTEEDLNKVDCTELYLVITNNKLKRGYVLFKNCITESTESFFLNSIRTIPNKQDFLAIDAIHIVDKMIIGEIFYMNDADNTTILLGVGTR